MADASKDQAMKMLRQASASQQGADTKNYYMRLIVYKARRAALMTLFTIALVVFSVIINHDLTHNISWMVTAIPITLLGLLWLLVPPTERWDYQPWQSSPQQVERHWTE